MSSFKQPAHDLFRELAKTVVGAFLASPWCTWVIAGLATAGVIARPFAWPEFVWVVAGACLLLLLGLLSPAEAWSGVVRGTDVYLFLTGMMLLSELALQEGLFEWLAAHAAALAKGSATRLFALVFGVGTVVTVFLSNDATAVVLTPAVAAVVKAAKAEEALPYLLICAFVANAASFVLPISNPANLVIYGSHMPPLLRWLPTYTLPSALSIVATYGMLRWTQRAELHHAVSTDIEVPTLSAAGKTTAFGIIATAILLLVSSVFDLQLGLPAFLAGSVTALLVVARTRASSDQTGSSVGCRCSPKQGAGAFSGLLIRSDEVGKRSWRRPIYALKHISWGVLPLVAGLFVLVEALTKTGVTASLANVLQSLSHYSAGKAAWVSGVVLALGCNLVNNLPVGLVAGRAVELARVPDHVRSAVLIGIDLGPNLSVTGSLATILWLTALRRESHNVSAWTFLKLGALVMPPALILALAGAFAFG